MKPASPTRGTEELMDVRDMPLSQGTKNALRRSRYWGWIDASSSDTVAALSDDELLSIRNIGQTRLREIREALANLPEPDRSWQVGA